MARRSTTSNARRRLTSRLPAILLLGLGVLGIAAFAVRVLQSARTPPPLAAVPAFSARPSPGPLANATPGTASALRTLAATPSPDELQFEDAPIETRDDGSVVLRGTVRNANSAEVFAFEHPEPLLLRLFDGQGQAVASYIVPLTPSRLAPGDTARWEQVVPPDVAGRATRVQRTVGAGYWSPADPGGTPGPRG